MIDTLITVNEIVNAGVSIGATATGGQIIKGMDNSLLSMILTAVGGFIIRAIEKRRLRKKGLLNDK